MPSFFFLPFLSLFHPLKQEEREIRKKKRRDSSTPKEQLAGMFHSSISLFVTCDHFLLLSFSVFFLSLEKEKKEEEKNSFVPKKHFRFPPSLLIFSPFFLSFSLSFFSPFLQSSLSFLLFLFFLSLQGLKERTPVHF